MSLYRGAPRTRQTARTLRAMELMASRVANVAIPGRHYDVFRKLRKAQFARYGDYGLANNPDLKGMPADQYLATNLPKLPSTEQLQREEKRSMFQTRDDIIRHEVGAVALSVAGQEPRQGIASPMPALMAGAADAAWVDDSKLAPTLAQTIGSGVLTMEQLQAASYSNVKTLFKFGSGVTEADKHELTFYLQRMILEGYVRGVDVVRDIKNAGGLNFTMQPSRAFGGTDSRGIFVDMNTAWRGYSDAGKLSFFYQEVGHALGQLNHTRGLMAEDYQYGTFGTSTMINNYGTWVDWFFQDVPMPKATSGTAANVQQVLQQNPAWFPSLTGAAVPTGGTPTTPGNTGGTGSPTTPSAPTTPVTIPGPTYNITPVSVNPGMSSVGNIFDSSNAPQVKPPEESAKTPVAGTLPDMNAVQSFAAGLSDAAIRSSGIADLNPLLRLKSG